MGFLSHICTPVNCFSVLQSVRFHVILIHLSVKGTLWTRIGQGLNFIYLISLTKECTMDLYGKCTNCMGTGHHEWFVHRRLITKEEMLHIPGFLKLCYSRNLTSGRNNCERNVQLEGNSTTQRVFQELQRWANLRWLTKRSDHNRNYNFWMWPDNVRSIFCYFLAVIPSLNVS